MAPISDEMLARPTNQYLVVRGDQTLYEALHELQAQGGREWWFLVVDLGGQRYLAARFSDLRERVASEGEAVLDLRLRDLGAPLSPAHFVYRQTDLVYAEQLAAQSPASLAIVLESGDDLSSTLAYGEPLIRVAGVLSVGGTRGAVENGPSLFDLVEVGDTLPEGGADFEEYAKEDEPTTPTPPMAPPAPATSERKRARETPRVEKEAKPIDVEIGGSVESGGQVIVAGDDVNIVYTSPPDRKTRDQYRRFEAAFPPEVHLGVEEKLFVAVLLPDASSPFGDVIKPQATSRTEAVAISTPVDEATGELLPVDIEVSVTTTGFTAKGGKAAKLLTVWPDGRTATRWFMLEPSEVGKQEILVELTHKGRLLDEIVLEAEVFQPERKARRLLDLSLRVISLNLQFSFALG
jgi:hypothetical protein